MKFIDIANRIDKSKENKSYVDVVSIGRKLNVDLDDVNQERITAYWIGNWYCTDSYVGYVMYFFDDEPMAYSSQLGRKCEEKIEWFSLEIAMKVREYLLTLVVKEEEEIDVEICDINEEVGEGYNIEYNSQLLRPNRPMLANERVEIVQRIKNKKHGIDTALKVKLPSGEEKEVDIRDLKFGFYINEKIN